LVEEVDLRPERKVPNIAIANPRSNICDGYHLE